MLISVIIPAYNASEYIAAALESVRVQTYRNFEVIVIDDGSSDDTAEIIASVEFPVRYFKTNRGGAARARNAGIREAKGELIAFLDADDLWLPEKLEKQFSEFEKRPNVGMVFTEHSTFNEAGVIKCNEGKRERLLMHGDIVRNIFLKSYIGTPTVMVRKSVFDTVGLFEEGLVVAEDDNMWLRIANSYSVELLDESLVMVRITTGSLSRTNRNIFIGVQGSIALLRDKYQPIFDRIGRRAIRGKCADLYFSEAYHYFSRNDYKEARKLFFKSFMYHPFKFKSILYLLAAGLPVQLVRICRVIKQKKVTF